MSEFDVVVRGGTVVDGTGVPGFTADIGVRDGRIAKVGRIGAGAAGTTIEADGATVTPGFVDIHTHYDAQLHWDPSAS
jgi:N-acyl-D-amino-acid deacylase